MSLLLRGKECRMLIEKLIEQSLKNANLASPPKEQRDREFRALLEQPLGGTREDRASALPQQSN
ncbi:MAG: hypothetical protein V1745_01935 [Patescibacteria group bacterium]